MFGKQWIFVSWIHTMNLHLHLPLLSFLVTKFDWKIAPNWMHTQNQLKQCVNCIQWLYVEVLLSIKLYCIALFTRHRCKSLTWVSKHLSHSTVHLMHLQSFRINLLYVSYCTDPKIHKPITISDFELEWYVGWATSLER